jgi:ketosteroid isomerase-like protein
MTDTNSRLALAREYFNRADAGRPDTLDLFAEDVELYFPKYGVRRGRDAFVQLAQGLLGVLESITHDLDRCSFKASGETVFVEGYTQGSTRAGVKWSGGSTAGGRFCSVFEFRGDKISRMYIYLDPDYAGADSDGFLWTDDGRISW